jgi:putative ABC transport system permease protein
MNPLPLIWADLRRAKAGALALVGVVALAVALGVAVSSIERGLRRGSATAADGFDILIGMPGSQTQLVLTSVYLQPAPLPLLPGEVLSRVVAEPGAAWAAPIAFADSWRGLPIVGTTAALATRGGRFAPSEGRMFAANDEAVIGARVPLAVGGHVEPQHGLQVADDDDDDHAHRGHEGEDYTIVGRLPPLGSPWDRAILVPVETVWLTHSLGTGHPDGVARIGPPWESQVPGVPGIVVRARSVADAYVLRQRYRSGGTMAVFPAEVLVDLYATLGDIAGLMRALAIATQVLVVLACLLAVLAALATRRRQIAVLRAIGASRLFVFAMVWGEVALLIAAASLLGLGLGFAGAFAAAQWAGARTAMALPVAIGAAELAMVAALALAGSLLAVIPALLGRRRSIAAELRS